MNPSSKNCASLVNAVSFIVVAMQGTDALVNLSKPYVQSDIFPRTPDGAKLIEIAEAEEDIHAFIALECGKVVATYGDQEEFRHLFSATKSWAGLCMGVAEKEGLLSLNETLWDIWPDEAIWMDVDGAEDRKKTTLEQLVQMRGGYEMPEDFLKDVLVDALPFTDNRLGGSDLEDSLSYHVLNTTNIGKYQYVMAGNILSYVIKERTEKTPEEYAKEKVFPYLGITEPDYEWYVNPDQVSTAFHGLKMTPVAFSKLGMLYLQNGMASDDKQIVDPSWIQRSWTIGDENVKDGDKFGYIGWWLGTEPAYATYGFGGQRLAVNLVTHRVVAILSDTYYKDAGIDKYDDPTAPYPTDKIKEWAFESVQDEPLVCETKAATTTAPTTAPTIQDPVVTTQSESGASIPQSYAALVSLSLIVAFVV